MLEPIFQKLAEIYNGKFDMQEVNVRGKGFSRMPISHYNFSFEYENTLISLHYEFGNYNLAEINFTTNCKNKAPDIWIETNENLLRLLRIKKKTWKIKSKDKLERQTFENALETTGLTKIADNAVFEPTISGNWKLGKYHLKTYYSLAFENKEYSIEPTINFQKRIINHLHEKYGG